MHDDFLTRLVGGLVGALAAICSFRPVKGPTIVARLVAGVVIAVAFTGVTFELFGWELREKGDLDYDRVIAVSVAWGAFGWVVMGIFLAILNRVYQSSDPLRELWRVVRFAKTQEDPSKDEGQKE